jgi:hypothetical protein
MADSRGRSVQEAKGPDGVIWLDTGGRFSGVVPAPDLLGPVPFDHGAHARWSAVGDGCAVCHHHTPVGTEHPACHACHAAGDRRADMSKPGLKGAYHRQCLGCHREWSHETRCAVCHTNGRAGHAPSGDRATPDDAVGTSHPPRKPPTISVTVSAFPAQSGGSEVFFDHGRHAVTYDLRCVDCHRGDGCARCHDGDARSRTRAAGHHDPCKRCHATEGDACDSCHVALGSTPPQPFDHATTGWPLRWYHARLGCREWHPQVPYTRRSSRCRSCHDTLSPASFDHGRSVGMKLDETHAELACGECHAGERFDRTPTCDACHDDIAYPAQRPGRPPR